MEGSKVIHDYYTYVIVSAHKVAICHHVTFIAHQVNGERRGTYAGVFLTADQCGVDQGQNYIPQ